MKASQAKRLRIYLTVTMMIAEILHLTWEHFHGGIVRHHLLNRPDLPAFSNAWGVLLLPLLSWVQGGFALRRVTEAASISGSGAVTPLRSLFPGFFAAFALALALALSFTFGLENVSSLLFLGILLLALVFPIYRGECLLGFVLGMTFTFGAVLPTLIGGGMALTSAALHRLLYPLVRRAWRRFGQH